MSSAAAPHASSAMSGTTALTSTSAGFLPASLAALLMPLDTSVAPPHPIGTRSVGSLLSNPPATTLLVPYVAPVEARSVTASPHALLTSADPSGGVTSAYAQAAPHALLPGSYSDPHWPVASASAQVHAQAPVSYAHTRDATVHEYAHTRDASVPASSFGAPAYVPAPTSGVRDALFAYCGSTYGAPLDPHAGLLAVLSAAVLSGYRPPASQSVSS
jgi:hypothetical protein